MRVHVVGARTRETYARVCGADILRVSIGKLRCRAFGKRVELRLVCGRHEARVILGCNVLRVVKNTNNERPRHAYDGTCRHFSTEKRSESFRK
jgi:hypothetical protein